MNHLILLWILAMQSFADPINFATRKPDRETIIGGTNANIRDFPYQISLQEYNSHTCGGVIISFQYILTAAHCVEDWDRIEIENYKVLSGTSKVSAIDSGHLHAIRDWIIHENFTESNRIPYNDIALIELSKPMVFNEFQAPISLAATEPVVNEMTIASGWGATRRAGVLIPYSEILQAVKLPIVSREQCENIYGKLYKIKNLSLQGQICTGYLGVGGRDMCQGDSGGPVIANKILVGLVSWGEGCAHPEYPGVSTSVSYYRDWILSHIKDKKGMV